MTAGRIAWSLFGLAALLAAGALALWVPTRSLEVSDIQRATDPAFIVAALTYAAVGALIVSRRFGNRVGWIFLAAGLVVELGLLAQEYAIYALRWSPGSLPGGSWAGLVADSFFVPTFGLAIFLVLVFPTGKLLSRRWRPVVWLAVPSLLVAWSAMVRPGSLSSVAGAAKPIEIDFALVTKGEWAWPGVLLAALLAFVSAVLRYRSGGPVERQQLRWLLAAGPIFVTSAMWTPQWTAVAVVVSLGVAALPVAAGIAIFRYRLYDLDLVVRRTLVYGALTAALTGLYFGIVIGLQAAFSGVTRGNDLAIAGSTLAVAALFRPARGRIQAFVDRRFYRRRYDAERTLAAFSVRLRDEVDLDRLGHDLGTVVHETMQPAHVSLWLRPQERQQ